MAEDPAEHAMFIGHVLCLLQQDQNQGPKNSVGGGGFHARGSQEKENNKRHWETDQAPVTTTHGKYTLDTSRTSSRHEESNSKRFPSIPNDESIQFFRQKVQIAYIMIMYMGVPLDVLLHIKDDDKIQKYIAPSLALLDEYLEAPHTKDHGRTLKSGVIKLLDSLNTETCKSSLSKLENPVFSKQSIRKVLCARENLLRENPSSFVVKRMQKLREVIPKFTEFARGFEDPVFLAVEAQPGLDASELHKIVIDVIKESRDNLSDFPTRAQAATRYINREVLSFLLTGKLLHKDRTSIYDY